MLRMLRQLINSQVKKHHAQKEQGLLVSKFSSVENELNEKNVVEPAVVEPTPIEVPVLFSETVREEIINESVEKIDVQELDSWKNYSESILDSLEMASEEESEIEEIIWYQSNDSKIEKEIEKEIEEETKETIISVIPEMIEEIKPIVYFHHIPFEHVEEIILAKFSFIKHENLEIKLNKHLDKENVAIHFKLENKKEMSLINKLLPGLVQELGLNLTTEVFKSKSDLFAFKVVLKEGDKKSKKKTNREVHA